MEVPGSSLPHTAAVSPEYVTTVTSRRRHCSPQKRLRHLRVPQSAKLTTVLAEMRQHLNEQFKTVSLLLERYKQLRKPLLVREETLKLELRAKGIAIDDPNLDVNKAFRTNRRNRTRKSSFTLTPVQPPSMPDNTSVLKEEECTRPRGESAAHCDTSSKSEEIENVSRENKGQRQEMIMEGEMMLTFPIVVDELPANIIGDVLGDIDFAMEGQQQNLADVPYVPPEFARIFGT